MTRNPDARELESRVDLRQIVESHWGRPSKHNSRESRWPAHWRNGDNPNTFAVHPDHWKDWNTGEYGGPTAWIMREYGLTFRQAVARLAELVGGSAPATACPAPAHGNAASEPTAHDEPPRPEWQKAIGALLPYFQDKLRDNPRVLAYLTDLRGLSLETIVSAGMGFDPSGRKVQIGAESVWIPRGIIIPWQENGALWALHIRRIVGNLAEWMHRQPDTDKDGQIVPKYTSAAGSHFQTFYRGDDFLPGQDVLIVEGEFDALIARQQLGEAVAVMTLGSASGQPPARWRQKLATAGNVYLALDTDQAGQNGAAKLAGSLRPILSDRMHLLKLPSGKDITEYVTSGGNLAEWLAGEVNAGFCHPAGVPDSFRSGLLTYAPDAAPLYELLNEAIHRQLINPRRLTTPDLKAANEALQWGMSRAGIERAAQTLLQIGFSSNVLTETPLSVGISEKMSSPHRQADVFTLASIAERRRRLLEIAAPAILEKHHPIEPTDYRPAVAAGLTARALADGLDISAEIAAPLASELAAADQPLRAAHGRDMDKAGQRARREYARLEFDLENPHCTPLAVGWPVGNTRAYRLAFVRAWMQADNGERHSLKDVAALLGLSTRKVNEYLDAAGVNIEGEQFEELPLEPVAADSDMERTIYRLSHEAKGKPRTLIARARSGETISQPYTSAAGARQFTASHHAAGMVVAVKFQVANLHTVDPFAEPAAPPQRTVSKERPAAAPEADQRRPAPPPRERRPAHFGYDPEWVRGQLVLRLRLLGWEHEGRFIRPDTGEFARWDSPALDLLALLLGHAIPTGDGLIDKALELGAVIRRRKGAVRSSHASAYAAAG